MGIEPVRPKAIIFDWDDTLIDNWQAIHAALNLTLNTMGHERWSFEKTKSNVRRSMRDSFPELFGDRWEEAADIFLSAIQSNHLETINILDGVPEMLASLRSAGIFLGIVSNKNGQLLREEAEFLGWTKTLAQSLVQLTPRETNQIQRQYIFYCLRMGFHLEKTSGT